jgi:hypothetical protein
LRLGFLLITFVLACFALSPAARAVCQEGCLSGSNTVLGEDALLSNTGVENTAIGASALYQNTTGGENTAIGLNTLTSNTTASNNTATGFDALASNTTGANNTANGAYALYSNLDASDNTALGYQALYSNTSNTPLEANTAVGSQALFANTTGWANTATGFYALYSNTIGKLNTANGDYALASNTTGSRNTAVGYSPLGSNTTGGHNVAYGNSALGNDNNTIGERNIAFGYSAAYNLTAGNNNVDIGNVGVAAESNTIRIGSQVPAVSADGSTQPAHKATFIAGIRGRTTGNANAIPVLIDSAGQLGTTSSSRRFKKEIKPMDQTSEAILGLRPVTFHYKSDSEGTPQFGLIAEEVAQVNPDLVVRDENGEIYTVRYEAVNAMLLNEFLKEHHQLQDLKAIVAEQQKQIEALTAGLQKVSDQLELSKPAPQIVLNNQ